MSRLPLETSLPMTGIGANQSVGMPRTRLESLTVNMVTPRIVTDDSQRLSQWFAGFGGAAQVAGQLAQAKENEAREIEKRVDEATRKAHRAGALGLGLDPTIKNEKVMQAYWDARVDFQPEDDALGDTKDIAEGKYPIQPGESISAAMTRVIQERAASFPEEYRIAYEQRYTRRMLPAFAGVDRQMRQDQFDGVASASVRGAVALQKSGEFDAAAATRYVESLRDTGKAVRMSETDSMKPLMDVARAFAIDGDVKAVAAFAPHFRETFPDEWARIEHAAQAADDQRQAEQRNGALRELSQLDQDGVSVAEYGKAVKEHAVLSDYERTALVDRYTQKRFQLAAISGRVEEIDAMKPHLSNDPDAQRAFAAYRDQAVGVSRKLTVDRIIGSVTVGDLDPNAAHSNLMGRLERWRRNSDDHLGLPPDAAIAAIVRLEREAGQITTRQIRRAQMAWAMEPGNEGKILATPDDDDALLEVWTAMGIADGATASDGAVVFRGMAKPEAAARQAFTVSRVPKQWADSIADAFNGSTGDSEGLQRAMRGYAALALRSPMLAGQIDAQLDDTGRVRAAKLMNEVNRQHKLLIGENGDPNKEWTDRIAGLTATVLNTKPVDLAASDINSVLWNAKTNADVREFAVGDLGKVLPETLQRSKFLLWTTQDLQVSPDVANEYAELARQAFNDQLGAGVPSARAAENAKALAADRLLAKRPPVRWNGVVSVDREAPHAFTPELEVQMLDDLVKMIPEHQLPRGWSEKNPTGQMARSMTKAENVSRYIILASDVPEFVTQTRPKWDATFRHEQGVGAWVLVGPDGEPLVFKDEVFAFVPKTEEAMTVKQLREKYERENRARREASNKAMNSDDRAILEAMFMH